MKVNIRNFYSGGITFLQPKTFAETRCIKKCKCFLLLLKEGFCGDIRQGVKFFKPGEVLAIVWFISYFTICFHHINATMSTNNKWPELIFDELKDTLSTVQLWTQIVGKIRLRNLPWLNHSWHVTLYVSPTGLTTGSIPYNDGLFQIDFDFVHHQLIILTDKDENRIINLYPRTVASFYRELMQTLQDAGIDTSIHAVPNEVDPAIPFDEDEEHKSYDAHQINTFWKSLVRVYNVFTRFRAGFRGKSSPVHFFWGSFDLAVTRFSGRSAPLHPGGAPNVPVRVMQEAYSHELSSCGFWPGNDQLPEAVFYAYCYPSTTDFSKQPVAPGEAYYHEQMGEFILPYESVRQSNDPEKMLLQFMQTTYEAAANTAKWDRTGLECDLTNFGSTADK